MYDRQRKFRKRNRKVLKSQILDRQRKFRKRIKQYLKVRCQIERENLEKE